MKQIKLILTFITVILCSSAQAQWQKVYQKSRNIVIYTIGDNVLMPCKSGGLVMSMDSGKSWEEVSSIPDLKYMNKMTITDSGFYASADNSVYKSSDSGKSWKFLSKWPYGYLYSQITASGQNLLAASDDKRVIISKDQGKTWDSSNNGIPATKFGAAPFYNTRVLSGFINWGNKTILCTVGPGDYFYETYDNGVSWSALKSDKKVSDIVNHLVYNKSIFVGQTNLLRSNDSGRSWQVVFTPSKPLDMVRWPASKGKVIMAGVDNEGVIISSDGGDHWKFINDGLDTLSTLFGVAINSGYAFCATEAGAVYRRNLSEFTSINPEKTPNEALNVRIYPNPLDRFATFEYGRQLHNGILKLYNMRGQEVLKIDNINESKTQFLRENLAAGTYIYFVSEGGTQLASGKIQLQ